jgi:DNA-binding NarL/FixJ family response regulator
VWELTPRQTEVLARLVAGLTNEQIATELGGADNTSELHVTRPFFREANVTSRGQLVAPFWSSGWGFPH